MKKIVCLCMVCLLILCGCGGDAHSAMTKEKKKELERYHDWYHTIYSEEDQVELYNFIKDEKGIVLTFTGKNQDIISFFAKAIQESNRFVDENPEYFETDTVIRIEYRTAGTIGILLSTEGEDLHFSNMLFQAHFSSIGDNVVSYSVPYIEIRDAQDMITYDKNRDEYDLTPLDSFSDVEELKLSFQKWKGQLAYDYDEIKRLVVEKMPDAKIEIEVY